MASHGNVKKVSMKIEDLTKEQIRQAILKKRECDAKAQKIVENLLEKYVTREYFLDCLPDINQSHFEDVIEERAIILSCGYPLCTKDLSNKDIPKQKYRISMRTNKVYDITARKSFCSNSCFKAAMYVKNQMLTSPLWFREYEKIPEFHLMASDNIGSLGQEVDVSILNRLKEKPVNQFFASCNDFAQASLNEITENQTIDIALNLETKNQVNIKTGSTTPEGVSNGDASQNNKSESRECNKTGNELKNGANKNEPYSEHRKEPLRAKAEQTKAPMKNPLNIVGEVIEKPGKDVDPIVIPPVDIICAKKHVQNSDIKEQSRRKNQTPILQIIQQVEKCLAEWFTIDTMIFLLGETRVREMVTDKGECIKEYLNNYAKGIFYSSNSYDQFQALCRKLNMLELEDRRQDAQIRQRETKPLPMYSMLQEESKKMQLKVKAFFAGDTGIPDISSSETQNDLIEDDNKTLLPLIDKNSQNSLRRRIVLQHLNKVMPDLLKSLGLLVFSISSDIRLLINTFKLEANNIMFKIQQWTLIAIVIIKLLSIRDQRLAYLLEQPKSNEHMQLLLLSYKQDGGYLDRLVSWLTDIDRLLDTSDTQLSIE